MISSAAKRAVLVDLHRAIDEAADSAMAIIGSRGVEPTYPPGIELSEGEIVALSNLKLPEDAKTALRKVLVDTASRPLFQWFAVVDGVADPVGLPADEEPWLGLELSAKEDDTEEDTVWHDEFFETYWAFHDNRGR